MGVCHAVSRASHLFRFPPALKLCRLVRYERRKARQDPAATNGNGSNDRFTYHFVGYTSLYRFYHHPDRIRLRLA
jgi:hypothetical protein